MKQPIEQLDKKLATLRPHYYSQLNAGLQDEAITVLEKKYGISLPGEVKNLYRWKNGQRSQCYEAFINNSMFMSLEDALSSSAELTGMIGTDFESEDWWHKDWLPLFHDGGGDYICHDAGGAFTGKAGQLIEFWHADSDRNVIAASLSSFLQSIVEYYKTTAPAGFNQHFNIPEAWGYPQRFSAG